MHTADNFEIRTSKYIFNICRYGQNGFVLSVDKRLDIADARYLSGAFDTDTFRYDPELERIFIPVVSSIEDLKHTLTRVYGNE